MDEQNNLNMNPENGGSAGPVIGVIIILAIIVLGGLYFWGQRSDRSVDTDAVVESIETQSEEDDTASIETDLDATDIENLDAELNAS